MVRFGKMLVVLMTLSATPAVADDIKALATPDRSDVFRDEGHSSASLQFRKEVELGKTLFFDKRLSGNKTFSCATCHNPAKGMADGLPLAVGSEGKKLGRHVPHLYNLHWGTSFFWDGRAATLEEQATMPIEHPDEMNLPIPRLIERLSLVKFYAEAFKDLYGDEGITRDTIARAIAAFERTLISDDSAFDRYLNGDKSAMSAEALRGLTLFQGKAKCVTCHHGPNLTDGEFHNTGVVTEDEGRHRIDRTGPKEFGMIPYPFFATFKAFKTPGLRNVELTAPYFHDGSEATLEDVIRFYSQGGKSADKKGLARGIHPLRLIETEIADLVAFLKALTAPVSVVPPKDVE